MPDKHVLPVATHCNPVFSPSLATRVVPAAAVKVKAVRIESKESRDLITPRLDGFIPVQ
jgi:hypothetical protein